MPRVRPNARHAFGGVWRLTARRFASPRHWLVLAGMLALLGFFAAAVCGSMRNLPEYAAWVSQFYVCFLVPVLSFITAAGVMRDDLRADTVDYVFTRPVPRAAFVVFRYLAHTACAQLEFLLALAVVLAVGVSFGLSAMLATAPVLLLAQVCAVMVFSAFGLFCGMLTARYVIIGLVYGLVVEVGLGNVPTQLSRISIIQHLLGILQPLLRGTSAADVGTRLAAGPLSTPAALAVLLLIATVFVAATAALFRGRELSGAGGRDA